MSLDRRTFLHLTALGAVTALSSAAGLTSSGPTYAVPALDQSELLGLMSAELVRVLGRRYRQVVPNENDVRALRAAIAARIPWTDTLTGSLESAVLSLIQRDFAEGRTVVLDGWILSVTEARQCALHSLLRA